MLSSTLDRLVCPKIKKKTVCGGVLRLAFSNRAGNAVGGDVLSGQIECQVCHAQYPILAGVAILVADVREYLLMHAKGVSQLVSDSEIPAEFREEFLEAKDELVVEHVDDDLEAERIVALYFMNHYLGTGDPSQWWKPQSGSASPLITDLIKKYWDHGPFAQIESWIKNGATQKPNENSIDSVIELGCGVGGLFSRIHSLLKRTTGFYLGVDTSFASIALARHINLGAPYSGNIRVPEDLLAGPVSREVAFPKAAAHGHQVDFIVGDLIDLPVKRGIWDYSVALNTIDMLDEPSSLPRVQHELLKKQGIAIQSCPYIWHERVVSKLRGRLPRGMVESSRVAEWLYERAGFQVGEKIEHLPWLFFKHIRQLEIYSVHLFQATRLN